MGAAVRGLLSGVWLSLFVQSPACADVVRFKDRVWARCSHGQELIENRCVGDARRVGLSDLQSVLAQKNEGVDTSAGEWVVPSVWDLANLLNCDSGVFRSEDLVEPTQVPIKNWCGGEFTVPTTDKVNFPDTPVGIYWTSSQANRRVPSHWVVNFRDGYIMDHPNSQAFYVRLMWSGSQMPVAKVELSKPMVVAEVQKAADGRWQLSANGAEVLDVQRGLWWQRCSHGQSWNGGACEGTPIALTVDESEQMLSRLNRDQSRGAAEGWRLPSLRELMSLVSCSTGLTRFADDPGDGRGKIDNWCDGNFTRPTIDVNYFPDMPARRYWTSTAYQGKITANWGIMFNSGRMSADIRTEKNLIRLVRSAEK